VATFTVAVDVAAPASRVWAALVDWPNHGHWAPLTAVRVTTPRPDGLGAGFVARSGLGPLGFDDPMTVTHWEPPAGDEPGSAPGRCDVDKHGSVIRGLARFDVLALTGRRTRVVWFEDVTVVPHGLDRLTAPAVALAGRLGFGRALRTMARDIERRQP
jgi:hypothetical protein